MNRLLLIMILVFFGFTVTAQSSSTQTINTSWGNYVNTNVYGYGNTLIQVTLNGQNSTWNGMFSVNGGNSYTPSIIWNNVKLISFSGYNAGTDDVQAIIMSSTSTSGFGGTTVVLKSNNPATGSATITVTVIGANASQLSLSSSASSPFAYTMASSAGTYNTWTVNGNLGIGTNTPHATLDVYGAANFNTPSDYNNLSLISSNSNGNVAIKFLQNQAGYYNWRIDVQGLKANAMCFTPADISGTNTSFTTPAFTIYNSGNAEFKGGITAGNTVNPSSDGVYNLGNPSYKWNNIYAYTPTFYGVLTGANATFSGNVLIGKTSQTNTSYLLDVAGNIRANKLVVNTTGADFVFAKKYHLIPLSELEKYIQQNKHLPGIEPAREMNKGGVDVGKNETKLLQKIEELTLYMIEIKKEMEQTKKVMQNQIDLLKHQNEQLESVDKAK